MRSTATSPIRRLLQLKFQAWFSTQTLRARTETMGVAVQEKIRWLPRYRHGPRDTNGCESQLLKPPAFAGSTNGPSVDIGAPIATSERAICGPTDVAHFRPVEPPPLCPDGCRSRCCRDVDPEEIPPTVSQPAPTVSTNASKCSKPVCEWCRPGPLPDGWPASDR